MGLPGQGYWEKGGQFNGIIQYRPDKMDYRISSISGKVFSGYHILAYYYVSWMLSNPEMVPQLQLPYEEEYNLAMKMVKQKNND